MDEVKIQEGAKPLPGAETTPSTFTKEQVDKVIRDTRSAALAEVGRIKKSSEDALSQASAAQKRLDDMIRQQEEAELAAAGDNNDALGKIKLRQALRAKEAEHAEAVRKLNEATALLQEKSAKETEFTKDSTSRMVATKFGVDPEKLIRLAKFTDGSAEAIEAIAQDLPKAKPALNPDSNLSVGGSVGDKEIVAAYIKDPRNLANRERYLEMRRRQGR